MDLKELAKVGIVKGAKIENVLLELFKEKYKAELETADVIEKVSINDYDEIILETEFTKNVKEIAGKKVEDKDRKIVIERPEDLYIYSEDLPEKINGEEFEIEDGYIDTEFVTIPEKLIFAANELNRVIEKNKEDWGEVLDLEDIKLVINDFEITLKEIKQLNDGIKKADSNK